MEFKLVFYSRQSGNYYNVLLLNLLFIDPYTDAESEHQSQNTRQHSPLILGHTDLHILLKLKSINPGRIALFNYYKLVY